MLLFGLNLLSIEILTAAYTLIKFEAESSSSLRIIFDGNLISEAIKHPDSVPWNFRFEARKAVALFPSWNCIVCKQENEAKIWLKKPICFVNATTWGT